ncbi:hypothetical protein F4677DRAFT_413899 [Hypoxylon crocopeplum]|nr:hypothetical protein F4677DRAFT_413899 [Hypoxylon crocopeplum]
MLVPPQLISTNREKHDCESTMANTDDYIEPSKSSNSSPSQDSSPELNYGCSSWILSSQCASDLYEAGVKLWRKEDLVDIEAQLARSFETEYFTVRRIDGVVARIKNPMYMIQNPIWAPRLKTQGYWRLVKIKPDGPPETYLCPYLLEWKNQTVPRYEGVIEYSKSLFETKRQLWNNSITCELFRAQLQRLLDTGKRRITKVVCFGLGDMVTKTAKWEINHRRETEQQASETSDVEGSLMQHAMALTMAEAIRHHTGVSVQLKAQDPAYREQTNEILSENGFEIVGKCGAGGFAEINDDTLVFAAFASTTISEVLADISRPALVITTGGENTFSDHTKVFSDAESPRTRQMWCEYSVSHFAVPSPEQELFKPLTRMSIRTRMPGVEGAR